MQTSSPSLPSFLLREVHNSRQPDTKSWHHLVLSLLCDGLVNIYHHITMLIVLPYFPLSSRVSTPISEWESCKGPLASAHPASLNATLITSDLISKPPSSSVFHHSKSLPYFQGLLQAICFYIYKISMSAQCISAILPIQFYFICSFMLFHKLILLLYFNSPLLLNALFSASLNWSTRSISMQHSLVHGW